MIYILSIQLYDIWSDPTWGDKPQPPQLAQEAAQLHAQLPVALRPTIRQPRCTLQGPASELHSLDHHLKIGRDWPLVDLL